jgi:hypothetical protein
MGRSDIRLIFLQRWRVRPGALRKKVAIVPNNSQSDILIHRKVTTLGFIVSPEMSHDESNSLGDGTASGRRGMKE